MAGAQQAFAPGTGSNAAPASAQQRARPFCQASKHGQQQTAAFSQILTTASVQLGPTALTASGGFVRRIVIETVGSGAGGTTAGIPGPDYPWLVYNKIRYSEPNNTPIFELSGFNTLLADVYGGYTSIEDPRADPDYSNNNNNPTLLPFVPIELDPTGMGALSDLSASSGYQLTLFTTPSGNANLYSTAANPLPTLTITVFTDYWTLPNAVDMNGRPQATVPPYAGTVQLWNEIPNIVLPAGGGSSRQQLNRMGNQLRTIIMVTRVSSSTRSDVPFPNPLLLRWDDVVIRNQDPVSLRKYFREFVDTFVGRDTGVHVFPFSFGISRSVGGNGVSSYLPTVTDTRFELSGTFGAATTPTLDWLVNDVSSAPLSGIERTTVGGGLGYYPPAGNLQTAPATM
jgi:hypothetical protein